MRLHNMAPTFLRTIDGRGWSHAAMRGGVSISGITTAGTVEAMCHFFRDHPLEPTKQPSPHDDALLFQISPGRQSAPPVVNITRQAYRGAGRSVQLALDVQFSFDLDPSRGTYFTLWSWDVPSLNVFISIVFSERSDRHALFKLQNSELRVDRF